MPRNKKRSENIGLEATEKGTLGIKNKKETLEIFQTQSKERELGECDTHR